MYYEQLKAGVIQHDLLVDKLIYKVRSSTATGTTSAAKIFIPFNVNRDTEVFRDCSDMWPPSFSVHSAHLPSAGREAHRQQRRLLLCV